MSWALLLKLLPKIVETIIFVERLIHKERKGTEKRAEAIRRAMVSLTDMAADDASIDAEQFDWSELFLQTPELMEKLGTLIDAVVDLMNFLGRFDREDS